MPSIQLCSVKMLRSTILLKKSRGILFKFSSKFSQSKLKSFNRTKATTNPQNYRVIELPAGNLILFVWEILLARRRSPLRGLSSISCQGLQLSVKTFSALWAEKSFLCCFQRILGNCWCSVVGSVTFSSNLSNLKKFKQIQKTNNCKRKAKNINFSKKKSAN